MSKGYRKCKPYRGYTIIKFNQSGCYYFPACNDFASKAIDRKTIERWIDQHIHEKNLSKELSIC